MDYLSDFGHWLLLSDAGLIVGSVLIWGGLIALAWVLISRYGDVRMGPDPAPRPLPDATTVVLPAIEAPPNYVREDWYPLAGELVRAIEETAAAVIDLTETVELRAVDPLDATAELEHVDTSVPLFYQIRRPRPYVAESFTQGIERAQIERALAAKEVTR